MDDAPADLIGDALATVELQRMAKQLKQERFDMFLLGVFVGLIMSCGCLIAGISLA